MITPSPTSPSEPAAEDGLDRLLREYYRAKMPRTFPPLPLDTATSTAMPRIQPQTTLRRGRLVLAACVVAVVLGFGYLLSIAPHESGQKPVGIGGDSSATKIVPHATPTNR